MEDSYKEIELDDYRTAVYSANSRRSSFTSSDISSILKKGFNITRGASDLWVDILNVPEIIRINKIFDDYFYILYLFNNKYTYYKCDQIDGLWRFLKKEIQLKNL